MSGPIFLVAAEASGDALGADLMIALRRRDPQARFAGVGGPAMAAQGLESAIDISDLSVLGLVEGLKAYGRVVRKADATVAAAVAVAPSVAVLIDSWGFTLRVATRLRRALPDLPLVKYVGPQVWATRPGRAKTLAAAVDHLICIHDFETDFYTPLGLTTTVAGHPAIGRHAPGDGLAFRARHALRDAALLLVAPGSRRSEIARTAPVLVEAARRLKAARPALALAMSVAPSVASEARALAHESGLPWLLVEEKERNDVFAAATVALAASGTVTTEIALQGAPVVVGYKVGWGTWAIARAFLMKARFITLLNVAAGREIVPEFVQTRFSAERVSKAAALLLDDPEQRAAQVAAQNAALRSMGQGGRPAAEIAADAVLAQRRG